MSKTHVVPRPPIEEMEADISAGRHEAAYEKLSAFMDDLAKTLARMGEHDVVTFVDNGTTKH